MSDERLRDDLRRVELPGEAAAQERAWRVVAAAYAERPATVGPGPGLRRRLAAAGALLAAALVAVGLALTPAGAQVREWIGDAIDPGRDDAKPALRHLPAPGDLLVSSGSGAWIVHSDGSKRLLGDYEDATWSPHGLYVGVSDGDRLAAVDRAGELRWSISRPAVSDPVWSPNEGFRIAYRSGGRLRVIWGDGANDAALARAAPVAPAWRPRTGQRNVLAFVDATDRVRVVDADAGTVLATGPRLAGPVELEWAADGSRLLALSGRSILVLDPAGGVRSRLPAPPGWEGVDAAFVPGSDAIVTIRRSEEPPVRSEVVRLDPGGSGHGRRLFAGSGRLAGLAWSPDGERLLVGWVDADQWLFLPRGNGEIDAVDGITREFEAGGRDRGGAFPQLHGWCCRPAG